MSATLKPHLEPERPSSRIGEPAYRAVGEGHPVQDDDLQMIQTSPTALAEPEVEHPAAQARAARR